MDSVKSWFSSIIDKSETMDRIRIALDVLSPSFQNDSVSGDPPLCHRCSRIFSQPQKMKQTNMLAHGGAAKFKATVDLGCYLCSLLYGAEWIPRSGKKKEILKPQRLQDLNPFPAVIVYWIDEPVGEEQPGCFELYFAGALIDNPSGDLWQLTLLLVPEKDIDDVIPRELSPKTSAEVASCLGITWIQDCNDRHERCNSRLPSNVWRPSRLVYVGPSTQPLNPKLYISEMATTPTEFCYTTISHCWGSLDIFRLLSSNINDLVDTIPLDQLPKVFRDAMDLTRRLGVEYIWIDSLCIIQDSYDDWAAESAMMGGVYKNSWCNIAATGFPDGSAGLYVQRSPYNSRPRKFNLALRDGEAPVTRTCQGKYYCMENLWQSDITNAPLNTRAWVFQERTLAPRVLHLGSRQVFWECNELEACEQFPDGIPKPLKSHFKATHTLDVNLPKRHTSASNIEIEGNDDHESDGDRIENGKGRAIVVNEEVDQETVAYLSLLEKWNKMTYSYNDKNLTKFEDKLIAISGIAKEMQNAIGYEYVAGLWARELIQQLMWCVKPEDYQLGRIQNATLYQAPSWSWASVNGPVDALFSDEMRKEAVQHPLAAIIDYGVTRKNDSEFGQITGGFLRIFGPLTRATFVDSDKKLRAKWEVRNAPVRLLSRREKKGVVVSPFLFPDVHVTVPETGTNLMTFPILDALGTRDFWLLPMCYCGRYQGIILQSTGVKGQYKRLGAWAQTDASDEETERFSKHVPLLEDDEYDEVDEDGEPTITII